jgi:putative ABC transport system ATP-binding protein
MSTPDTISQAESPETSSKSVIIRTVGMKQIYDRCEETTYALRGVNVEIYTGEFIVVMGPSGSGKSTFFNMIGALDSPARGGCSSTRWTSRS